MKKKIIKYALVVEVTEEKNQTAIVLIVNPPITNPLGPYLSKIYPFTMDIIPFIIPPGNSNMPALDADKPITPCIYNGNKIFVEKIMMLAKSVLTIPTDRKR